MSKIIKLLAIFVTLQLSSFTYAKNEPLYKKFVTNSCFGPVRELVVDKTGSLSPKGQWEETSAIFVFWNDTTLRHIEPIYRSIVNLKVSVKFNVVVSRQSEKVFSTWFRLFQNRNEVTSNLNIIFVDTDETNFLRDPFIILRDNISGNEVFYQTPSFDPRKIIYPNVDFKVIDVDQLIKDISKQCKKDVINIKGDPYNYFSDATRGGNFVLFPGNVSILFDVKYRTMDLGELEKDKKLFFSDMINKATTSFDAHINFMKELTLNTILRTNSFSDILPNHSDEVFTVVKNKSFKKNRCDFSILVASPKKAYDLMGKIVKDQKLKDKEFCRSLYFYTVDSQEPFEPLKQINIANEKRKVVGIDDASIHFENKRILERIDRSVRNNMCLGLSGKTLFEIFNDQSMKDFNLQAWNQIESHLKVIKKSVKNNTGCESIKILEVPMIFQNNYDEPDHLLSNPINSLVITSREQSYMLMPDPMTGIFRDHIQKELSSIGVGVKFLNTSEIDHYGGNLHCISNSY